MKSFGNCLPLISILLTCLQLVHSCSLLCNILSCDYTIIYPFSCWWVFRLVVPGVFIILNGNAIKIPAQVSWNSSALPSSNLPCKFQPSQQPHSLPPQRYYHWVLPSCTMARKVLPGRQTWWTWGSPCVSFQLSPSALPVIQLLKTVASYILSSFVVVQDSKISPILISMSWSDVEI